jgi:sugar (pentulose or hexulose) kinase
VKATKDFLAFDIGASNGKAVVGEFDGNKLACTDVYHFPNDPVAVHDSLHWDVLRLFFDIKKGILQYRKKYGSALDGIGINTWGVDFGLFDRDGKLIGNPHHYRDQRTQGMLQEIREMVGGYRIYSVTGVNLEPISTICQLYSMVKHSSPQLELADRFLMMPNIFHYFLTEKKCDEYSNITATGLYDYENDAPAADILQELGIPASLIPPLVKPGTIVGRLGEEFGLGATPVIVPATHDSASAVISVPADPASNWAYLSCGTWSVFGIETDKPATSEESYELNITNAATSDGKYMTRTNITGLWIVQECKRIWDRQGMSLDYDDMVELARNAQPFSGFIDVDDPSFANPPDMPAAIVEYCRSTFQNVPTDRGTIIRMTLENLALRYREVLMNIERLTGKRIEVLHIVGGGVRNQLLCQFTANALGIPVLAGPVEATSTGNVLVQMIGAGLFDSVSQGRQMLKKSLDLIGYMPGDSDKWQESYEKYQQIIRRE